MIITIKKALESTELFTTEELEEIEAFLDREFNSPTAQVCIASVFIEAKKNEWSVAKALAECEKEWKRNWTFQRPDARGDPLAPEGSGRQNAKSLWNIYDALGVPKGKFVVKTLNSTYWFGKDEGDGMRFVSTDSCLPLLRHRCEIITLVVGKEMELDYGTPGEHRRTTSVIVSIDELKKSPKEAGVNAGL
ncbi:MAG: hypothetical protein PHO90_02075 [Candidatus Pacebacteria bacterium]|nr:hypothetical protein [Candidatus Paceibacterota bacterium]